MTDYSSIAKGEESIFVGKGKEEREEIASPLVERGDTFTLTILGRPKFGHIDEGEGRGRDLCQVRCEKDERRMPPS